MLFRLPVYTILLATCLLVLATRYGDPSLLYRATREDGLVEWATVAALLFLAGLLGRRLFSVQALPKLVRLAGWGLALLSVLAAGEEISWGQRLFGFQTNQTMQAINYQHEMNLHNLVPAELFNGLIVFALGISMVLVPMLWRAKSSAPPLWLPSPEVSLLMLDAILINHYSFRTWPEKIGILVILGLLAWQTVAALMGGKRALLADCAMGWLTVVCLYHARSVLMAANFQYEIRELVIVVLVILWANQTLDAYSPAVADPEAATDSLSQ